MMFNLCKSQCRGLYHGRFYYCSIGLAAINSGQCETKDDGYILLEGMQGTVAEKEALLNFDLGQLPKGYIDHCKYCKGQPSINHEYVIAAVQIGMDM